MVNKLFVTIFLSALVLKCANLVIVLHLKDLVWCPLQFFAEIKIFIVYVWIASRCLLHLFVIVFAINPVYDSLNTMYLSIVCKSYNVPTTVQYDVDVLLVLLCSAKEGGNGLTGPCQKATLSMESFLN